MRDNEVSQTHTKGIIMGWGSGYHVFNNMADALIEAGAPDEVKHQRLAVLIAQLQEEDWDTELDSLQGYRQDPGIVSAFAANGIVWED
jgi:hypothetical protein